MGEYFTYSAYLVIILREINAKSNFYFPTTFLSGTRPNLNERRMSKRPMIIHASF